MLRVGFGAKAERIGGMAARWGAGALEPGFLSPRERGVVGGGIVAEEAGDSNLGNRGGRGPSLRSRARGLPGWEWEGRAFVTGFSSAHSRSPLTLFFPIPDTELLLGEGHWGPGGWVLLKLVRRQSWKKGFLGNGGEERINRRFKQVVTSALKSQSLPAPPALLSSQKNLPCACSDFCLAGTLKLPSPRVPGYRRTVEVALTPGGWGW